MTDILFDDFDGVQNAVSLAATSTYRRFFDYCEREDLVGAGWEWACSHTERVNKADRPGYLVRDLKQAMSVYARREKAALAGYSDRDEFMYGKAVVEMALPAVLNGVYDPPQRPVRGEGGTKSDPAESGGWMAVRADVSKAWEVTDLTDEQREALALVYGEGHDPTEAGEVLGVTRQAVSQIVDRGIARMIEQLSTPARDNRVEMALRKRPRGTAQVQEQWT